MGHQNEFCYHINAFTYKPRLWNFYKTYTTRTLLLNKNETFDMLAASAFISRFNNLGNMYNLVYPFHNGIRGKNVRQGEKILIPTTQNK